MLLRSGKDLSPQLDFNTCSKKQTLYIENRGLWHPPMYMQVHEESYPSLAKMNSLGFITVDSVDYKGDVVDQIPSTPESSQEFNRTNPLNAPLFSKTTLPRTYGIHPSVSGFMRPNTLLKIKNKSNHLGASVGLIHHIITEEEVNPEDFKRIIMPLNYYKDNKRELSQCFIRLYYDREFINYYKKSICLHPDEDVEYVTFIDMQNNFNPNTERGLFTKIIKAMES